MYNTPIYEIPYVRYTRYKIVRSLYADKHPCFFHSSIPNVRSQIQVQVRSRVRLLQSQSQSSSPSSTSTLSQSYQLRGQMVVAHMRFSSSPLLLLSCITWEWEWTRSTPTDPPPRHPKQNEQLVAQRLDYPRPRCQTQRDGRTKGQSEEGCSRVGEMGEYQVFFRS